MDVTLAISLPSTPRSYTCGFKLRNMPRKRGVAYRYGVAIATGVEDLTRTICHQLHDRICKKKKKKLIQMLHRGNKGEGPEGSKFIAM